MSRRDRVNQIKASMVFVRPVDVGVWRLAPDQPSPTDAVLIAPADLAWLLDRAVS